MHVYETRCLPGDQGRNPYVLASCGSTGYGLEAVVVWRISYVGERADRRERQRCRRGRPRAEIAYPVTESRGFLVPGASP